MDFFKKLQTLEDIPSTSVPSQGEMLEILREAMKDHDHGIYVTASKKLSGINRIAETAAKKLKEEGKDVRVFDSEAVVTLEGLYAYAASRLAKEGKDVDTIFKYLNTLQSEGRVVGYEVLTTLKYLQKNGRIGKLKGWLGSLFSFRPILTVKEGALEPVSKARTDMQALEIVVSKLNEDIERTKATELSVMYEHGIDDSFLRGEVIPRIQKEFKPKEISTNQTSTAIACHAGPESWGVGFLLE
jgi:DegV family protein with EDD domain